MKRKMRIFSWIILENLPGLTYLGRGAIFKPIHEAIQGIQVHINRQFVWKLDALLDWFSCFIYVWLFIFFISLAFHMLLDIELSDVVFVSLVLRTTVCDVNQC